jgi:hypothetical protein
MGRIRGTGGHPQENRHEPQRLSSVGVSLLEGGPPNENGYRQKPEDASIAEAVADTAAESLSEEDWT